RRPNRLRGRIGSPSQAINRTTSCQPATASSKKMLASEQSNLFKSSDHGPQARASSSAPERGHPTANVWAAPNLGSAGSAAQIGALGDSAPCPLLLVSLGRPLVSETDRRSQPILRRYGWTVGIPCQRHPGGIVSPFINRDSGPSTAPGPRTVS